MKRIFVFFILLLHINSYMFLYQGAERDLFDSNGKQYDDINSLTELIMCTLGYDKHAEDEDDDNGNNFIQTSNFATILTYQEIPQDIVFSSVATKKSTFISVQNDRLLSVYIETTTPPPDLKA